MWVLMCMYWPKACTGAMRWWALGWSKEITTEQQSPMKHMNKAMRKEYIRQEQSARKIRAACMHNHPSWPHHGTTHPQNNIEQLKWKLVLGHRERSCISFHL